ncbi:alkaline phosphatase family protein [Conexibacter sp. CPCC 206217]|uniref:alkaline phosphatase family protein n=1 Tax=Conexibacter sp. CPCC 206217 TaxID=3064574 RepID=UPI002725DFB4|nr:alkaline phosphatase family protein [Conexibacter sp. CPCC 206217]MDO8211059.1 alkaline phosphatase family protein [Conexibacter sp. CPCC 206217]
MRRWQLALIATLSLLSTVFVLTSGSAHQSVELGRLAADRKPVTIGATPVGQAAGATASADAAAGDADDTGAPDEVVALDDETGASEEPAASSESAVGDDGGAAAGAGDGSGDAGASGDSGGTGAGGDSGEAGADGGGTGPDGSDGAGGGSGSAGADETAEPQPTKIRHVFVVTLAGQGFDAAFGPGSTAAYLNGTLRPKGALLDGYASLGSADLPDYIALLGGQPPNADTRAGCPTFREIPPSTAPSRAGVIAADGCVYPNTVTTLGDQLTASRRTWRAYVEDLERGPDRRQTCRRPDSNGADDTLRGRPGDGYATRHNPFVYFHSLLDLGDCDAKVGGLTGLQRDLRSAKGTPAYSFIVPNLCNGGGESPCADGSPGGLPAADAFLKTWAPRILASPAYRKDGLLIVTFAGGPAAAGDPAAAAAPADAPVRNGTLLVSRFAQAGSTAGGSYDPYSLLRSVEDLFALRPLARAARARSFAPTVLGRAFVEPPSDG